MPDCEPDQGSAASGPTGHSRAVMRPREQGGLWRAGAEWPPLMVVVTVWSRGQPGDDRREAKMAASSFHLDLFETGSFVFLRVGFFA